MSELPFFVYGTLRPGERNHELFLRGRTSAGEPARLAGVLLHDGPGHPYAVRGAGQVAGELISAAPGGYGALLCVLDRLEGYAGPGHPRNLYEREVCEAVRLRDGARVRAWVYLAAPGAAPGAPIPGGDWLSRPRLPGAPRTP
ncbi:gamma-glutamylcyclotransferase family protein [Streptomyces sp. NPDC050856]|uniref:gamma-glutamylcyclotransferase family protein n=1 Tax=Streptomyces sp. NPDC050856 TaxID=3154939 RepID=UPI0033C9F47E